MTVVHISLMHLVKYVYYIQLLVTEGRTLLRTDSETHTLENAHATLRELVKTLLQTMIDRMGYTV